jgi:hypothetical protein
LIFIQKIAGADVELPRDATSLANKAGGSPGTPGAGD